MRDIGLIGNYYGGLFVKQEGGKYFWAIESYDGNDWQEIPQYLFDALNRFEDEAAIPASVEDLTSC